MKILTKITLFLFIMVLTSIFIVDFISYYYSKSSMEKSIGKNQLNLAAETIDKIDRSLYRGYTDIQIIAGYDELGDYLKNDKNISYDRILKRLDEFTIFTGPWDILSVLDESGEVVISSDKKEINEKINQDPNNYMAYNQSLNGNVYYSDVIFSEDTGKPTIIFSAPIKDKNSSGKPVIGVVIGHFAWPAILDIMYGETSSLTTLYTQNGVVIGSSDPDLNDKILNTNHNESISFKKAIEHNGNDFDIYPSITENFELLTSHAHQKGYMGYKGNNYILFIETPTIKAFAPSIKLRNFLIIVLISIGILFFIIIMFASKTFTNSIRKLYMATKKLKEGDYKVRVDIKSKDEIEELGNIFNETISKLEKLDEERKQIDKAKSEFLNVVSHELKTPLTIIYAYLDILNESNNKFSKEQLRGLSIIRRNSDRLKELINNILERSRIDAGKFELVYSETNLKETIERIVKNLKIIADKYENKIIIKFDNIPKTIKIDTQRFEEILNNLISNAIKFTKKGIVKLEVSSKGNFVFIKVIDNGIGIPNDKIKNLFQKFYQIDSGLARKYEGSGLGLSITKNIIELMGGEIWVESIEGKGSTFSFTIPIKPKEGK